MNLYVNAACGLIGMTLTIAMAAILWGWPGFGLAVGAVLFVSATANELKRGVW